MVIDMMSNPKTRARMGVLIALTALVSGPAVAQLALPGQGVSESGSNKPVANNPVAKNPGTKKPVRKARPQTPARLDQQGQSGASQQGYRQPSYEDLAPQGSGDAPGIRPGFRGGKPTLNMGF